MRLSSILSYADKTFGEVQSFINDEKYTNIKDEETEDKILIKNGDFIEIQIGRINTPFFSTNCNDNIIFASSKILHCLIINSQLISIDCELTCTDYDSNNCKCNECKTSIQAWFLVGADDIYSNNIQAELKSYNYKLPSHIKLQTELESKYSEWLIKADIAFRERLGAGAIIYLRSIFEKITHQVGLEAGINIYKNNGKMKPFDQVLLAVDSECKIIPSLYSDNGYALFGKLSEIAHGNSDEQLALKEYTSLKKLVISIVDNVESKKNEIKNNKEIMEAISTLGWTDGGEISE